MRVGAGHSGFFDDCSKFRSAEAQEMDRVGRRCAAAIRHDLDEIGAALQFFAGGTPDLVDAVADAAERT
jgi:hypothetical protein